ncbi:hypothetical protein AJ80_00331 [Polytolypa hystricis UAMH7299]|uniref:protein-tyrosine-phosphatase n=1 Tax=Polytolypa hystricis (strain UAMH7299) TaxID=1447883 RepID=A0A2B7Z392_POLH7|nr:hypothetical protein AJ80_00331 [Polytolypa hystricis UAMH7299]
MPILTAPRSSTAKEVYSRSPAIVIAYLMRKHRKPRDEVLALVSSKRKIRPNPNFLDQLQVWGEVEYQIWEDEEETILKQAYKEYLARRAEWLKEKGLTGNEPIGMKDLDSW